jgi:hypothetical protein
MLSSSFRWEQINKKSIAIICSHFIVLLKPDHRHLKNSILLKFCYVPATSTASSSSFKGILRQPLTVITRQMRQAVHAINQSIFLRCLWAWLTGSTNQPLWPVCWAPKSDLRMAIRGSTVVEHLTCNLEIEGSNPVTFQQQEKKVSLDQHNSVTKLIAMIVEI